MGKPVQAVCQDWGCPARASCARHFGRHLAYWSMSVEPRQFMKRERKPGFESCLEYEPDTAHDWMVDAFSAPPVSDSWRMPLFIAVEGSA